jgi:deoxycytidine triphosphate deaminase
MYLSSTDISRFLEDKTLQIVGTETKPFMPHQIRPGSVDVRLPNEFWTFKDSVKELDLLDLDAVKADQDSLYNKSTIPEHQSVELLPGHIIITRLHEHISLPSWLAGKFEGRSSFARLGISVHCSGDFINPGWSGHMAVQLVNHNSFPIRIYPFAPIGQVILIPLSSDPAVPYDELPDTIYKMDRGGTSKWFSDRRIEDMAVRIGSRKYNPDVAILIKQTVEDEERKILRQIDARLRDVDPGNREAVTAKLRTMSNDDRKRNRKQAVAFFLSAGCLFAAVAIWFPFLISATKTRNFLSTDFWLSTGFLGLVALFTYVTFDIRLIPTFGAPDDGN